MVQNFIYVYINEKLKTEKLNMQVDAKFEKFWLKYVVADLESDVHGERLLECVIDFNSSNV